ncbi:MAG: sensor histidine kinase [Candidatus Saccharicenans sp.]
MRKSEIWLFFLLPYFLVLGLFALMSHLNRQAIQHGVESLAKEQLQATATILKSNIKEFIETHGSPAGALDKFSELEDVYFVALLDKDEKIIDWHSRFEGYLPFSRRERPSAEFWVTESPVGSVFNHYSSFETGTGQVYHLYLGYSLERLDRLLARSQKNFYLLLALMALSGLIIFAGLYRLHESFQQARAEAVRQAEEKEKFKEISGFTAGVAHEIKNPLNSLVLLFELLEKKAPPEFAPLVKQGKAEAHRAAAVVDRFSEIIKPLNLKKERVTLNEIVAEEIISLRPLAESRQVEVELQASKKIIVEADRLLIGRAVHNLIKNALEASSAGQKVLVRVELVKRNAVCSVIDQGPGLDQDKAASVFEPFVTGKESGLGIGLYLVRKIVEAHGGEVSFTKRPEGGTVFTIKLPGGQDA